MKQEETRGPGRLMQPLSFDDVVTSYRLHLLTNEEARRLIDFDHADRRWSSWQVFSMLEADLISEQTASHLLGLNDTGVNTTDG